MPMHRQLSLFKTADPEPNRYSVFFAIFPDHHTAQQIIELGNTLLQIHGLHGRLRPLNHLHVSLFSLGNFSDVPETLVETVGLICKPFTAAALPFEIKFNRALSFRGKPGNNPLVLIDAQENNGVRHLYKLLTAEFSKYVRSTSSTTNFMPHLTLLYDKHELTPQPVEQVSWIVKEIVLVRSEVGATKYQWLGRWALGE
jgi:2'-5' RNA ligase